MKRTDKPSAIRHRRRLIGYPDSMVNTALDERIAFEIERDERRSAERQDAADAVQKSFYDYCLNSGVFRA